MHLPALLPLHRRGSRIRGLDPHLCLQGRSRGLAASQRLGLHLLDSQHDCQDYFAVHARKSSREVRNFAEIPSCEYFCSAGDPMDRPPRYSFLCRSDQFRLFPIGHVRSLLLDRTGIRVRAEHNKHCKFRNVRFLGRRIPRDANWLRDGFLWLQGADLHNLPLQRSHVRHFYVCKRTNGKRLGEAKGRLGDTPCGHPHLLI